MIIIIQNKKSGNVQGGTAYWSYELADGNVYAAELDFSKNGRFHCGYRDELLKKAIAGHKAGNDNCGNILLPLYDGEKAVNCALCS